MKTQNPLSKIIRLKLYCSFLFVSILFSCNFLTAQENKDEFKPSGKVWGYAFGDFFYKADSDSAKYLNFGRGEFAKNKQNDIAVTFRRIYLGYDYNISPNLFTNILLESNDGILTGSGKRTVFVKSLFLEWKKIIPRASVFIGQSSTPTWPIISEPIWGLRNVEKTIADYRGFGGANDLGIRITGKFDTSGVFGYTLMWGNGKGDAPEVNVMKKVYASLDARLFQKKLTIQLQTDYEDAPAKQGSGYAAYQTILGFISYQHEKFTVAMEGVYQTQQKAKINKVESATDTIKDSAPFGLSVWAKANLNQKLTAFVRFDNFSPDINYKKGDNLKDPYNENFFTTGLDIAPHKNWHIIPNLWINSYKDKRESTETGYHARTADVVGRITFQYTFK
ncbi:MAG: hypothetical protein A3G23_03725 [Bacteroidetes bacterium RIFCSPLOWO2_12_FULL_37_12]|nr:MAG: hypothetical protein A3G23_03725 [Bacteroidetes bacterium RIFCSPLOWO2_12_FULL_37_12]